jgi:hypothetical protein
MIPRPSWYSLEDLQEPPERGGWGLSHDALLTLAEDGQLNVTLKTLRGEVREGITAQERLRIEGEAKDRELRTDAKRSRAEALAITWAYAFGADPDALKRFANATELEQFAARARIPLSRSHRTYADIFAEAVGVLVECGYLTREAAEQAMTESESQREAA